MGRGTACRGREAASTCVTRFDSRVGDGRGRLEKRWWVTRVCCRHRVQGRRGWYMMGSEGSARIVHTWCGFIRLTQVGKVLEGERDCGIA